jgi:UDP-2,3-diacylglucosamine hydrolase
MRDALPESRPPRPTPCVLAIESGKTIVLDQNEVLKLADKVGITIVSLYANESELRIAS